MKKRSSRGRGLVLALVVFFAVICLLAGVFWWSGRERETITLEKEYYFLARECEKQTASAVAGQVYFSGGAGYLWGDDFVIAACYFTERDAQFVQESMEEKGIETCLVVRETEEFTLHGEDAAYAERVRSNAETADACARILFDTANGLERLDRSQEEARAALDGVTVSLAGLRAGNGGSCFDRWNALLLRAERRGRELSSGILFAKDLRYLQIELCLAVADLKNYFA